MEQEQVDSPMKSTPRRGKRRSIVSSARLVRDWHEADFILHGDSLDSLKKMPDGLIQVAVTSPPYYGQRDYGCAGQVGIESTPQEYIEHLVKVFREVRRVLREDGTLWLNLGDKYVNNQLLGMPWRVAIALIEDGWILRSDVIWQKPNAMPSSVKTRPTTDHEYIFMFSKSKDYYYDADSIREPHVTFSDDSKMRGGRAHIGKRNGTPEAGKNGGSSNLHNGRWDQAFHPLGRNKRTVWSVPLGKFRGAHFAVFPEKLIEPCVIAGSPRGGIVLDPFFGAGTTGLVAVKHHRRFIGLELNKSYCEMAEERLSTQLPETP
ncbi:site-specific DNA-methyltransferase [Stenotrophomonas muris]|uniref:DNA-methyltransferase n=1 Tax=Stenotrophomonas muris TaxID=2963283 RepID=UPI002E775EB5|nr:site-specific DNA-methyltransferase [Stenotrophomonas muris]